MSAELDKIAQAELDITTFLADKISTADLSTVIGMLTKYNSAVYNFGYNHCFRFYNLCSMCCEGDIDECSKDPVANDCPRRKQEK